MHLQRFFYFKSEHKISLYSRTDPFKVNELQRKSFSVGRRHTNRVGCIDGRLPFQFEQLATSGVRVNVVWPYNCVSHARIRQYIYIHTRCLLILLTKQLLHAKMLHLTHSWAKLRINSNDNEFEQNVNRSHGTKHTIYN